MRSVAWSGIAAILCACGGTSVEIDEEKTRVAAEAPLIELEIATAVGGTSQRRTGAAAAAPGELSPSACAAYGTRNAARGAAEFPRFLQCVVKKGAEAGIIGAPPTGVNFFNMDYPPGVQVGPGIFAVENVGGAFIMHACDNGDPAGGGIREEGVESHRITIEEQGAGYRVALEHRGQVPDPDLVTLAPIDVVSYDSTVAGEERYEYYSHLDMGDQPGLCAGPDPFTGADGDNCFFRNEGVLVNFDAAASGSGSLMASYFAFREPGMAPPELGGGAFIGYAMSHYSVVGGRDGASLFRYGEGVVDLSGTAEDTESWSFDDFRATEPNAGLEADLAGETPPARTTSPPAVIADPFDCPTFSDLDSGSVGEARVVIADIPGIEECEFRDEVKMRGEYFLSCNPATMEDPNPEWHTQIDMFICDESDPLTTGGSQCP